MKRYQQQLDYLWEGLGRLCEQGSLHDRLWGAYQQFAALNTSTLGIHSTRYTELAHAFSSKAGMNDPQSSIQRATINPDDYDLIVRLYLELFRNLQTEQ